jgi:hypothetical protein
VHIRWHGRSPSISRHDGRRDTSGADDINYVRNVDRHLDRHGRSCWQRRRCGYRRHDRDATSTEHRHVQHASGPSAARGNGGSARAAGRERRDDERGAAYGASDG